MLDLIIRGGQVVTPSGVGFFDVAVRGERVAAITPAGMVSEEAARVIDATGKLVIPGGVDPHIHANWPVPEPDGQIKVRSAGPAHVSKAALLGGTTTFIDFAVWQHGMTLQQAVEQRDTEWRGNCASDYAFHVMLHGGASPEVLEQLPELIQAGFPSIKMFTTDITPSRRGRKVPHGEIWEVLQILARHGGIAAIHAEDDELVQHMYAKLEREGRTHFQYMPDVHSSLSEDLSFRRVIRLAESVPGAALYMMHVSAATGVRAIAEARAKGLPIYGETLHHYALYTRADYLRPNGQIYHNYPSLKEPGDTRELWRGMADGTIQSVATDGICTPFDVKVRGSRIDDVTGGSAGVQPRVGLIYTEAVVKRGHSLEHFVDLVSANAARTLGLYPQKGALAVGSDADVVLLDPSLRHVLTKDELYDSDYSPWEGWQVEGWPVLTILRGQVVAENGQFLGDNAAGRLVHRKLPDSVLAGPARQPLIAP